MSEEKASVGFSADAYTQRDEGYSPEEIRDAAWAIIHNDIKGTVLDAGSGNGGWIQRMRSQPDLHIISVDIVDDGASQIEGVEFHLADLSHDALPVPDNSVDLVTALEVIEHLANPRHFFSETFRVLKPEGKVFISTPSCDALTSRLSFLFRGFFPAFCDHDYLGSGHITPITELDLQRISKEMGFRSVEFHYPLRGRLPKLDIQWQSIFPFLHGKLWSDSLFAVFVK